MTRKVSTARFTRPADTTAYASGDLIANSATAGSVAAMQFEILDHNGGGSAIIRRARILKTGTGVTNATARLHLFTGIPTAPTNGDNGVFASKTAGYLGSIDVTIGRAFSDGAGGASGEAFISLDLARNARRVYGLLEATGAYTPASAEVFSVTIESEIQ